MYSRVPGFALRGGGGVSYFEAKHRVADAWHSAASAAAVSSQGCEWGDDVERLI
jgi:hypothetical protein